MQGRLQPGGRRGKVRRDPVRRLLYEVVLATGASPDEVRDWLVEDVHGVAAVSRMQAEAAGVGGAASGGPGAGQNVTARFRARR